MENKIGEIKFLDIVVPVYYHVEQKENITTMWSVRNPDAYYHGYAYLDKDGTISYPEGTVLPEFKDNDGEVLPKFTVIGSKIITDEIESDLLLRFKSEYNERNKHKFDKLI
jgi:hypothetical protein